MTIHQDGRPKWLAVKLGLLAGTCDCFMIMHTYILCLKCEDAARAMLIAWVRLLL